MATTVLVAGASGFVGSALVADLVSRGITVKAMTRHPGEYDGPGDPVFGDVADPDSLGPALAGAEAAYYLVHSLDSTDFEHRDAEAARAFGRAAADAGVRQIIYLGGLGRDDDELSAHLRSRREVESLLGEAGVPVTVLRAAIVVGAGGISWEITRQLVKNLPVMVVPKWAATRTQPVGLDDVVRYLVGVLDHPDAIGAVFEIGGSDQLTYVEMLRQASLEMNMRDVRVVQVPVLTPKLSSYWIGLVTSVDTTTATALIDSMSTEVLATETSILQVVPGEPLSYREAVRRALAAQ